MSQPSLASLDLGFCNAYLDYQRLTAQLHAWATAFPDVCRLQSLGQSPEGRELWLLIIGQDPERRRPAVWVDGNMHAIEVAGSSVALAIAQTALRIHLGEAVDLPAAAIAGVKQALLYVMPRMSPDGAETVLRSGQFVRSVPRDQRIEKSAPRWVPQDIDGNGTVLAMRVLDPAGELVESKTFPGLLVERTIDDEGPFYKLFPEGMIANFDGRNIPSPYFLGHAPIDLNRNFPWSWRPGHEQPGAGPFPTSEPESRAVVEFVSKHPEIMVWLNLHTFGGVAIRPLGQAPDDKMNQEDLAIFRQIEDWMKTFTGYPTVSGYHEFLYEPDKPLYGDLTEFAYHQRGALAYVVELWDIFARLGMAKPSKFVKYYEQFSRRDLEALRKWDEAENQSRLFVSWERFVHPQLGEVEIGGIDPRIGIWNPSLPELRKVCDSQCKAFLRTFAMLPQIVVGEVTTTPCGGEMTLLTLRIENRGYLGTFGLPSAKQLDWNEPVYAKLRGVGCELVDSADSQQVLGHLDGWGRGVDSGANLYAHPHTRGSTNVGYVRAMVRGSGSVRMTVGSARMGFIEQVVNL